MLEVIFLWQKDSGTKINFPPISYTHRRLNNTGNEDFIVDSCLQVSYHWFWEQSSEQVFFFKGIPFILDYGEIEILF